MRILFLTNFYPPYGRGGYEERCYETAGRLKERGHPVSILTSRYGDTGNNQQEEGVHRLLHLESDLVHYQPGQFFTTRRRRERENLAHLEQSLARFKPDVFFVWGMWNLSKTLPATVERKGQVRVIYSISDPWPTDPGPHDQYWQSPSNHRLLALPKRMLAGVVTAILEREGRPNLNFENAFCVSAALRDQLVQAGAPLNRAEVIHNGIDPAQFTPGSSNLLKPVQDGCLRLLYAGGMGQHKGVHTAIDALAILKERVSSIRTTLTLVGSGHPAYVNSLREHVNRLGLNGEVHFLERVPRQEMPELYRQHDILVLPSVWEEPLARAPMEAMASGLVVVATTTGGTKELLEEGENALTFKPENPTELAAQVERLIRSPDLYRRLAQAGRQTILDRFTLDRMFDQIESYLLRTVG